MPVEQNNRPDGRTLRLHYIFSFASLLLLAVMVASTFFVIFHPGNANKAKAATSFGFTYTGDYDQTSATAANLQEISNLYTSNQISFNLGLGDFSYLSPLTKTDANNWSSYVTSSLPSGFPFEIVDGRHDSSQISTYEADLPDRIGDVQASCTHCKYGQQYYFDYPPPPATPLARFIMLSPNQTIGGYTYSYNKGSANYNWVKSTIDGAHTAGIPWVIVGMHQYCFVIGTSSCTNQQLLDLLLTEHVDVILQAQKHNYQASKQLALNSTTCPTLNATSYNANCVVNATQNMTQGAGTVIVVTGTGGASQLAINTSDPKLPYFRAWSPATNAPWGVTQFTISPSQLTEQFVPTSGGTFTDSFTITNSTFTPTPSTSPTTTPTGTLGAPLASDTFQRPNQTYWGTASDGHTWGANANSYKVFSISNDTGQVYYTGTTNNNYYATLGPTATDAQVQFTGQISSFSSSMYMGAVLRWSDSGNWYEAYIDGTNLYIKKKVSGSMSTLKSTPFGASPNTQYTLLFSVTGSTLNASVWPANGSPPANWMLTYTDTSLTAGYCGLHVGVQSGTTIKFTSFQATSLP